MLIKILYRILLWLGDNHISEKMQQIKSLTKQLTEKTRQVKLLTEQLAEQRTHYKKHAKQFTALYDEYLSIKIKHKEDISTYRYILFIFIMVLIFCVVFV